MSRFVVEGECHRECIGLVACCEPPNCGGIHGAGRIDGQREICMTCAPSSPPRIKVRWDGQVPYCVACEKRLHRSWYQHECNPVNTTCQHYYLHSGVESFRCGKQTCNGSYFCPDHGGSYAIPLTQEEVLFLYQEQNPHFDPDDPGDVESAKSLRARLVAFWYDRAARSVSALPEDHCDAMIAVVVEWLRDQSRAYMDPFGRLAEQTEKGEK